MPSSPDSRSDPAARLAAAKVTQVIGAGSVTASDVPASPIVEPGATPRPTPGGSHAGMSIGPYRLVEKVGEGGMGSVWKATHSKLDKTVALKLLPPHLLSHPEAVARFEREMRAAGRVAHPHVVQAFDAGEAGGLHYLAMEYVEGSDFQQLVAVRGPLSVRQACRAVRQAALGLAAAHAQGLVHRDVKPQNLLLSKEGKVKLLDLGLARLAEQAATEATAAGLTAAGQVMGTPDYMAPEQWEDTRAAGEAADLYALGCTLYFLLTGKPPFGSERHSTIARKMQAHVAETAPSLRAARPEVPPELDALCVRLLAKNPKDRPASAAEVASALAPFANPSGDSRPGTGAKTKSVRGEVEFPVFETPPVVLPGTRTGTATHAGGAPPKNRKGLLLAAAGGLGGLALFGVIFALTLDLGDATLTIESFSPDVEVTVTQGGKRIVVLDPKTKASAELDPGTYELTLKGGNGEAFTSKLSKDTVTLSRRKETLVRIVKVPKPAADGSPPGMSSAAAATDHALEFDGDSSYVKLRSLTYDGSHPLTIEAWLRPRGIQWHVPWAFAYAVTNARNGENVSGVGLKGSFLPDPSGRMAASWQAIAASGGSAWTSTDFEPGTRDVGRLMHVAAVFEGEAMRLYIDGWKINGPSAPLRIVHSPHEFVLGARAELDRKPGKGFRGEIDELRFSDTARYADDFTPTHRFEPDEHTLALYHFDEGAGTTVNDASGRGHDGQIVGAKWLPGLFTPEAGAVASDPRRAAVLSVFDMGGWIRLNSSGTRREVRMVADLPVGPLAPDAVSDVYLEYCPFSEEVLERLRPLAPTGLDLNGTAVGDIDLRAIRQSWPNLRMLTLFKTAVTDAGLKHLEGWESLDYVDLNATRVTDAGLPSLRRLPLTRLVVADTPITDAGLREIRDAVPGLVHLGINATAVTDAGLEAFKDWTSLNTVNLARTAVTDAGLETLRGLRGLTSIDVTETNVTGAGVSALKAARPDCKVIWAPPPGADPTRDALRRVFEMGGWVEIKEGGKRRPVRSADELPAGHFPSDALSDVHLPDLPFDGSKLYRLRPLAPTGLNLNGTLIVDADLPAIRATFPKLQALHLYKTKITDSGLKHLEGWETLRHLDLNMTQITDGGMPSLSNLKLYKLILANTPLTDEGLAAVRTSIPGLAELVINGTAVTDEGLKPLQGWDSLTHLIAFRTGITDMGLETLESVPRLTSLDLSLTKVTSEGVEAFKAARPECQVTWETNPATPDAADNAR